MSAILEFKAGTVAFLLLRLIKWGRSGAFFEQAYQFRGDVIGIAIFALWTIYWFIVPSMPTNYPFGYLAAISLISMLSVSYAWIPPLAPRDWKRLDALPNSFSLIIVFLVLWWGTAFSAIGWMFAAASAPPPLRFFSTGVYVVRETPHLIQTAGLCFAGPINCKMNKAAKRNMIA